MVSKYNYYNLFSILIILIIVLLLKSNFVIADSSLFYEKILLSEGYHVEIKETIDESIVIELYFKNTLQKTIITERSGIKPDLIQKIPLTVIEKNEYFISTFYKDANYISRANIVIWENEKKEWDLFLCPFVTGFAEDRNNDGVYEIVEYYGNEQIFSFRNGYLVKIGDEKIYNADLLIDYLDKKKVKDLFNLQEENEVYFGGSCNLTPMENDSLVVIYGEKETKKVKIGFMVKNKEYFITVPDVETDDFRIRLLKLEKIMTFEFPQFILEYSGGKGDKRLYAISWIEDQFEVVFKCLLYDFTKKTRFYYKFFSEEGKNKVKVWNEVGKTTFILKNNSYIKENYIAW